MAELVNDGVKIIAPPIWMLLSIDNNSNIVPSQYAIDAKAAGLNIIAWSLERSGPLKQGGGYYYQSISDVIDNDGDMFTVVDVFFSMLFTRNETGPGQGRTIIGTNLTLLSLQPLGLCIF